MIISEVVTLGIYAFSMVFLPEYFGVFFFFFKTFFLSAHIVHASFFQICRSSFQCGLDGKSRLLLR